MPTDINTSVHASPVRWTDDEWNKIVVQLYQLKGADVLTADGAEAIKARDVFEAQNVLPVERHRKQISIAQGFQQIRARLRGLFERGQQENLFPTTAPLQMEAAGGGTTPTVDQALPDVPMEQSHSFHTANHDLFAEGVLVSYDLGDKAGNEHPLEVSSTGEVQLGQEAEMHSSRRSAEQRAEDGPQPVTIASTKSTGVNEKAQSSISVESNYGQSSRRAEPPSGSLAELIRPFVAMVCEELARALVQNFPGQGSLPDLASRLQSAGGRTSHRFEDSRSRPNPQRSSHDDQPRRKNNGPGVPPTGTSQAGEAGDDEADQTADAQPLFDPKLPPSANSDFKPMIALVATRDHEYEEMQLHYPQLRFLIVPAEDIHGPEVFRDCQRVIGLHGEVPHPIEEMLKRSLRYRYIWLHGGVERVREQLDAWLANPSSMQAMPRSAAPRVHTGSRKGNGKKQGKWPPRVA